MKSSIFVAGIASLFLGVTLAGLATVDTRQKKAPSVGDLNADVSGPSPPAESVVY